MCIFFIYLTSWLGIVIVCDITWNILSLRRKKGKDIICASDCFLIFLFIRVYYSLAVEFIVLCKQICACLCVYVLVCVHMYVCWQEHTCMYFHKIYGNVFFRLVLFCLNLSQTHSILLIAKESTQRSQTKSDKDIKGQHQIYFTTILYHYIILLEKYIWRVRFRK